MREAIIYRKVATVWQQINPFKEVDEILKNIQDSFGENVTIMDNETGEVLEVKEIARVRGILDMVERISKSE